jgi:hypothetical protein
MALLDADAVGGAVQRIEEGQAGGMAHLARDWPTCMRTSLIDPLPSILDSMTQRGGPHPVRPPCCIWLQSLLTVNLSSPYRRSCLRIQHQVAPDSAMNVPPPRPTRSVPAVPVPATHLLPAMSSTAEGTA